MPYVGVLVRLKHILVPGLRFVIFHSQFDPAFSTMLTMASDVAAARHLLISDATVIDLA